LRYKYKTKTSNSEDKIPDVEDIPKNVENKIFNCEQKKQSEVLTSPDCFILLPRNNEVQPPERRFKNSFHDLYRSAYTTFDKKYRTRRRGDRNLDQTGLFLSGIERNTGDRVNRDQLCVGTFN